MGPRSLMDCSLALLPQPQASLTSAPHLLASMPTYRSTIFPTQRPFLRSATSRYVLPQEWRNACHDVGRMGAPVPISPGHLGAHLPSTLSLTETSGALLCPRQGTLSWAIQGEFFFAGGIEKAKGQQAWEGPFGQISCSH